MAKDEMDPVARENAHRLTQSFLDYSWNFAKPVEFETPGYSVRFLEGSRTSIIILCQTCKIMNGYNKRDLWDKEGDLTHEEILNILERHKGACGDPVNFLAPT